MSHAIFSRHRHRRRPLGELLAVVVSTTATLGASAASTVVFVDASLRDGAGDGTSWVNAFRGPLALRDALSSIPVGACAELWLADGTYLPAAPGSAQSHQASFELRSGIGIYGGFAGGEGSRDERDPSTHLAILTGDLLADDVLQENGLWANGQDNVEHVVVADGTDATAVLDGVMVRRGSADSGVFGECDGGNVRLLQASATIVGCTIEDGYSLDFGAGISIDGGSPTIRSCIIRGNSGTILGAGLNARNGAMPLIETCLFTANRGGMGIGVGLGDLNLAGIHGAPAHATIRDCRFEDNGGVAGAAAGSGAGAGMFIHGGTSLVEACSFVRNTTVAGGGGVFLMGTDSRFDRCDFVENVAQGDGGAGFHGTGGFGGLPKPPDQLVATFVNCRFVGNNGVGVCGGGLSVDLINCTLARNGQFEFPWPALLAQGPSSLRLMNCVVWDNALLGEGFAGLIILTLGATARVDFSCIQEWDGSVLGSGTFAADPVFVDAVGPDGTMGTEDDDLRLALGSPCVDSGSNALVPGGVEVDFSGAARFVDDPQAPDVGEGEAPLVDRGAHERQGESGSGCSGEPADLDASGVVDGADLGALLAAWGGAGGADLDASGTVDGGDVGLLLAAWGECGRR